MHGNTIQFDLVLSGPAVLTPYGISTSGSSFGIGLWDSTGLNPLLTSDPNGFAGIVNLNLFRAELKRTTKRAEKVYVNGPYVYAYRWDGAYI